MMKKRFAELNINWSQACVIAEDRVEWNKLISSA